MGRQGPILAGIVIALVMALVAAGCGGGSDSEANDTSKTNEIEASQPGEGEPSRAFLATSEEKKIPKFGQEASAKEREAASKVLKENLDARETGDWATQCATLSPAARKSVTEVASIQGVDGGGCVKELKIRARPLKLTKSLRINRMTGPIDALRFKGSRAYALYHGVGGADFAMPMEKVNGEWKVGDILDEEP